MNSIHRLAEESVAFDSQIAERVAHGHVPDMRRTVPCDYFYNNSWRRPEYVALDFGEQFDLLRGALAACLPGEPASLPILEVGCGPGHMTLEFARTGYQVTGIDISEQCIRVARSVADSDPWRGQRGGLTYIAGDFFSDARLAEGSYAAVIFIGTLHHFRDQGAVMDRVNYLLRPDGIIMAHEPTRDRVTEGNAAFIHLLRLLLATCGGFHAQLPIPRDIEDQERQIAHILAGLKYEDVEGGNIQSANDNDAGHAEMSAALADRFDQLDYRERYAFFHEIIGGLRFDEETNVMLARYLRDMDGRLCKAGVLQATEFFFAGRKKGDC